MRIQNFLLLFVLVSLATVASVVEASSQLPPQPFTQVEQCRTYYFSVIEPQANPTSQIKVTAANRYCYSSTRILSASAPGFCQIQKLLSLTASTECASTASVLNAQGNTAYMAALTSLQGAESESRRQTTATPVATNTTTGASTNSSTGAAAGSTGGAGFSADQILQLANLAATVNAGHEGRNIAAARESGGPETGRVAPAITQTTQQVKAQIAAAAEQAGKPPVTDAPVPPPVAPDLEGAPDPKVVTDGPAEPGVPATPQPSDTTARTPGQRDDAQNQAQAAQQQLCTESDGKIACNMNARDDGADDPNSGEGPLTESARAQATKIQEAEAASTAAAQALTTCGAGDAATKFSTIAADLRAYSEGKDKCARSAQTTEKLCLENPAAKNVKTIMEISGPVLAAVNATQKVCSGAAKVTDLASKLLMLAKGACVTAKVMCDTTCSSAQAKLKSVRQASGEMSITCTNVTSAPAASKALGQAIAKINLVLTEEDNAPIAGSRAQMSASCESKVKDIIGFGINIASVMAANSKAKACERQMAANNNPTGQAFTLSAYCEQQENRQTQVCQCQSNPQMQGCASALSNFNSQPTDDSTAGLAGTNLRNSAGLSNFAGGGTRGPSDIDLSGSNGSGSGSDSAGSLFGADKNGSGLSEQLLGGGGGASSAGGFGGSSPEDKTAAKEKEEEKNKPSFGSAAISGISSLGSGRAAPGNGALATQQQREAAQRKLASEQLNREISTASGKSNWEKVREQYLLKSSSLLVGQ